MATRTSKTDKTDILIAGGGAAGCTLAILLAMRGIDIVCADQESPATALSESFDGRTTAISYGSRKVLQAAGVWDTLENDACPIETIKISDNGPPSLLDFQAPNAGVEAFGWIVENRLLRRALFERLAAIKNARHLAPARLDDISSISDFLCAHLSNGRNIEAQLIIGADGKNSFVRDWMGIETRGWVYRQNAIVCVVAHQNPHNNIAIEDFRTEGPFAILPMKDDADGTHRSALVWTDHTSRNSSPRAWDEDVFNAALAARFPAFYGAVRATGPRYSYPLSLRHAQRYTGVRTALIADAAHAIHPIAGQGLNMGLRDVAALAEILSEAHALKKDFGDPSLLAAYESARRADTMAMAAATDGLNRIFSNKMPAMGMLRKAGLRLVQKSPKAKLFFMRQAMGLSGHLPTLIRTGKLP
jgi:2-octaprenyl-6-methoxyphenol hydroxylase